MSPEVWQKVSGALDQLLDLTGQERDKFLERLRAEDPVVCQEVESLSAQPTVSVQLESPPTELLAQLQPTAALHPPPELPKQLGGYRIVSILGAGGMGVVYEAEDPTLQRRVALKVIKREFAGHPDARARFLREARAAAALQHDHVLPIYHVGEEAGVVFLVMPLLQGETLEDRLRREPELPLPQILRIGREIAEGLAAAHARGLIHRDIKPANLWLEAGKDRIKIMDFGLARPAGVDGNMTQTGMIVGTPAYMAPEQGRGDDVDGRADLFSLGCVLYRMCTGTAPFLKKDSISTMLAAASERAVPPSERNRAIPRSVSDLILKLLAKPPADRPQSAGEVAQALEVIERSVSSSASESARAVSKSSHHGRSRWSRAILWTISIVPLILIASGIWYAAHRTVAPEAITNSIGMKLTLIPAGEFMMGSPESEIDARTEEHPQHHAQITQPFYLGTYSVTRGQFARFVAATGYKTDAEKDGKGGNGYTGNAKDPIVQKPEFNWRNTGFEQTDEHPVVNVSWNDAVAFCKWLSDQEGKTYRLPTEAEWEYACRAGSARRFFFGDDPQDLASYANTADATAKQTLPTFHPTLDAADGYVFTAPVGSFRPNPFGLYDMVGNVWQYCSDWYRSDYYRYARRADPAGPEVGSERVIRGGSWVNSPARCRCATRGTPGRAPHDCTIGFRVVRELGPPTTATTPGDASINLPTTTNSIGMKLTLIPAGEFMMGNEASVDAILKEFPDAKPGWLTDAEPRHRVRITRPFYLGTFSVTRGQFAKFVAATNYQTDAEKDGNGGWGYTGDDKAIVPLAQKPEFTWRNTGFAQTDDHPVVNVSWSDALAFCKWLSDQDGKTYRLPTEAEWEYACRAGTTTAYFFGDNPEDLAKYANVADGTTKEKFPAWTTIESTDGYVFTAPVGQFKPNNFGLYDMHGNAWQWCQDWYGKDYYGGSPRDGPQGPATGSFRVIRGGGWSDHAVNCRSAHRYYYAPTPVYHCIGFRVACEPEPVATTSAPAASLPPSAPIAKLPTITNSTGIKLTLIPAGDFMMGSPENESGARTNEHPQHRVRITKPFYLGTYDVTNGQFAKFVAATSYKTDAEKDGKGGTGYTGDAKVPYVQKPEFNWRNVGFTQTDDHPVVNVSYVDAVTYCKWLSDQDGKTYRLPTEAEWEYACRAGTKTAYFFGDSPTNLGKYTWYLGNSDIGTHEVGQKLPNAFGLYDILGNVWQYCSDWYGQAYYNVSPLADPPGPDSGTGRVLRGGSVFSAPALARCAERAGSTLPLGTYNVGFRVVREPDRVEGETRRNSLNADGAITPRVAETGKLIFKDDFDTEAPKAVFAANLLNFENVGGVGQLTTPTKDVLGVYYVQQHAQNFVAECDFELPGEQSDKGYGFYFRGQPQGVIPLSVYLVLVHPKENRVTLSCFQTPTYTLWNEYPCREQVAFSRSNRVRLEALGGEFRVFVNGVFACRAEDAKIPGEGTFGLSAFSGVKGDYGVNFKNLRVYELNAPYTEPVVKPEDAAPRPAPNGELAFKDDFDSSLALPSFQASTLSFANHQGQGHFITKAVGIAVANYPNHTLNDFIAEVEVESNPGGAMIGSGLVFRGRYGVGQGRPSYRVVMFYPKEQKVWLGSFQETSWAFWTDHPCPPKLIFVDRPNLVRLEAKDDRFRVFLNGGFVWELHDARSKEGGLIGLSANAAPGTEVKFSKLRVYHFAKEGNSD